MSGNKMVVTRNELRLVTDNEENNHDNQPTRFHISRWLVRKQEVSKTACGRENYTGFVWAYYSFIADNTDVMCPNCVAEVEVREESVPGMVEQVHSP